MYQDICPATNAKFRRVLPSLHAITMSEVMERLPVVVCLVAVEYWRIGCCNEVSNQAYGEGDVQG